MASLYKKPIKVTDPETGERITARSRKWWGRFKDLDGREKRVPLAIDKTAAQAMLNDLVRKVELEKAKLVGRLLKRIDVLFVDREHAQNAAEDARRLADSVRGKHVARRTVQILGQAAADRRRYPGRPSRRDKGTRVGQIVLVVGTDIG